MFPAGSYKNPVITFLKFPGERDHSPRMAQTPFKRADQYIVFLIQGQADTWVSIPSMLTILAMRFNSDRGTFFSSPPSGVSLEMV